MINQEKKIVEYIETHGSITALDAMRELGVMRLASRIADLKKHGYAIVREMETGLNRDGQKTSYARYKFLDEKTADLSGQLSQAINVSSERTKFV